MAALARAESPRDKNVPAFITVLLLHLVISLFFSLGAPFADDLPSKKPISIFQVPAVYLPAQSTPIKPASRATY
jgi:hypothetical protein